MATIDPKRPTGHIAVLAQDEPGGPLRLTRHATQDDAALRLQSSAPGGITVHESDAGQIVYRPKGMRKDDAARIIEAHRQA